MRIPIVISTVSLGTGTTATQLSGDRSGNATDFVVPTWCRSLTRTRTQISQDIPTAAQTCSATMRITSTDLNVGNYEVLAEPLGSVLGATAIQFNGNGQNAAEYPWNMGATRLLQGGEHFQFYGQSQIANTADDHMGAMVWADSQGPDQTIPGQWYSLAMSLFNNSSNPVSTGTSSGSVSGTSFTISGQGSVTLRAVYGYVTTKVIVAGDLQVGYFQLSAPEIAVPIQWNLEPTSGFLGATGQLQTLISQCEGIAVSAVTPTTISPSLVYASVISIGAAGTWIVAAMYQ